VNELQQTRKVSQFIMGLRMFVIFLKTGTFTFGGGLAMIPVLEYELCEKHKYLTDREFLDYVAISQSLPGVVAINISIMSGRKLAGYWGAFMAALAMAIPAFVSIILILMFLISIRTHPVAHGFLGGVKAASAALIFVTAVKMWRNVVNAWWKAAVAIVSFVLIVIWSVNVVWVILGAGALGLLLPFLCGKDSRETVLDDESLISPQTMELLTDSTAELPLRGLHSRGHFGYTPEGDAPVQTEEKED